MGCDDENCTCHAAIGQECNSCLNCGRQLFKNECSHCDESEITKEEIQEQVKYFGEYFYGYLYNFEKMEGFNDDIDEHFVMWWNQWIKDGITKLDINWPDKRAAYVLLQLGFIELKGKGRI